VCDNTTNCDVDLVAITNPGAVDLRYNNVDPCGFVQPGDAQCVKSFRDTCQAWVNNLQYESATHGSSLYDKMSWIGHIGFWVPRSGSCHCAGKAMDISKIQWNGVGFEACNGDHAGSTSQRRRYLAVDASLRRFFKWTLDAWYNSAHLDHIHASSHYSVSNIVLDKASISDTVFVQAVCNNFNGAGLKIDGAWGSLTDAAFAAINRAWNFDASRCNPFSSHGAYSNWLHRSIAAGFANTNAVGTHISDSCNF
jgi:hypothetical protein